MYSTAKDSKNKMSKSNKIVWTDEILYFVIKHVKNAPFVWDHSHPQFAFKSRKAKFWSLLAAKVNSFSGFNLTTPVTKEALQKKWTNMKTYYLFEESKSRRVGFDKDNFGTTWKFRSTLAFLGSSIATSTRPEQNSTGVVENSAVPTANASECSFDLSEDDPLATQDGHLTNVTIKKEPGTEEESPTEDPCVLTENDNADAPEEDEEEPLSSIKKRPRENIVMKARTIRDVHRANFYHYGMTIAQDLDQLDEDYKIDAKLEIMQIIAKYKREQYLNQTVS